MRKKFTSVFLSLVMYFTSLIGVNAATLSETLKLKKDINKIKINKEINISLDNDGKNKKIKLDKYYGSTVSYPLKSPGDYVGYFKDSWGTYEYMYFEKIQEQSSTDMTISLLMYCNEPYNKDKCFEVEFLKDNGSGSISYIKRLSVNLSGFTNVRCNFTIPKSYYEGKEYIYMFAGVSPSVESTRYNSTLAFKVKNPYYNNNTNKDGYVVVSNESTNVSTQYTGTFSVKDKKYNLNKKLEQEAYKMDVDIPFNAEKNKDKLLLNKKGEGKAKATSYRVGDSRNFYTYNFTNDNDEITSAKLLYSGSKADVWVNNNQITSSDAYKLGKEFENKIYSKDTTYFGSESDVDNDGKINILCYDIKDGFSGSGGYTAGYFYARDLYDMPYSNKCEIFYIDTYPSMGSQYGYKDVTKCYETLAHEFQHMINFNNNVLKENGYNMDTWLNEGMSMAAEQIYSGKVLSSRINYYNNSSSIANGHSLLYWDNNGDVLSNYSLSYLFLQYFKVQTNQGDKIFKELQGLKNNDYRDIETLIKKYIDPNLTFGKFMTEFRSALLLKQSTGLRGFKGVSGFNSIKTPLYYGSGKYIRGGGAVVKEVNTSNFQIPRNKGSNVTFTLLGENEESNEKPVINGVSDKTIRVGESFDPREGVSASDKEDGDLTSKIQISGSVDTTKEGKYTLTYSVVDSDNNKTTAVRNITVASDEKPVINGVSDKTIRVGESFDPREGVSASDKEDGDLTSKIQISGSVDTTKEGKYTLTYSVVDSDNNKTTAVRNITVASDEKPVINGVSDKTIRVGESFDPREGVSASDKEDGDLTSKIQISGSVDTTKEGKYTLTYSVVDSDNNKVSKSAVITVIADKIPSTNLSAKLNSYNSIKLTWNKVSGINGYEIYRSTSKTGKYSLIKTITSASTTSYTNTKLTTGKTYYYKIRSYKVSNNKNLYGNFSSIVSAKPQLSTPSITLSSGSKKAYIKWKKIAGASGYEIYRATSKNGTYSKIKTITSSSTTSYTNSKLIRKKTYYYKIRAYKNVSGKKVYSSYSSVKYIKTK